METEHAHAAIEALLEEQRTFPPPEKFRAGEFIGWFKQPTKTMDWKPPHATWFADGELNVAWNCLDKQVEAGRGGKIAYHWVGEPEGETRDLTYEELLREVSRLANGLRSLGVRKGDRIGIYMGMVPELPVAMLACARIGAAHVVVFGGFSAESLAERMRDTGARVLITQDEGWRKGSKVPLKGNADDAAEEAPDLERFVVLRRTGDDVPWTEGRDVWWDDLVDGQSEDCEAERMNAEDVLFLLHTSGTTAKPKGAQHTTAGYLLHVSVTHKWIFDIHEDTVWWCVADVGWITGHSYIVYGPRQNGSTSVHYEGDPAYPDWDRHWEIVEHYGVNSYYTAPTLIRSFVKMGPEYPARHDLSSLRLLGTVGEPINPEAWVWYWKYIGRERCPIVDTWWQTETGGILITPLPGITTLKPGSATVPFPGIKPEILVEHGAVAEAAATGAADPDRGQRIVCFVLLKGGREPSDELAEELGQFVAQKIGKIARPAAVLFGDDLPKTRSGKIMRRLLKDIAEGNELGDTTTLRDSAVVDDLKQKADAALRRG